MRILLGRKIGMKQVWDDAGRLLGATIIAAEPNTVIHQTNGLAQVAVARAGKTKKPQAHIAAKIKSKGGIWLRSLATDDQSLEGQLTVSQFPIGSTVKVWGVTKGKGFAGVVKRHGFAGQPASHGHSHQRRPGSIGAQEPQRVPKGQKMAGRMGGANLTVRGLKILQMDEKNNLLTVKGAVPGPRNGQVVIMAQEQEND